MSNEDVIRELRKLAMKTYGKLLIMPSNTVGHPEGVFDLGRHLSYVADCFFDSELAAKKGYS